MSFSISAGETLGLVGESGSGKSVTAMSIARVCSQVRRRIILGGEILLNGRDVLKASKGELRKLRGGVVSYIFQEPGASLNPVFRIGRQIKESLKLHRPQAATGAEVDSAAEVGGDSGARIPRFELSARNLRWNAATSHDRFGAGFETEAACGGRTHHCAGCDVSSANPRFAPGIEGTPRHEHAPHHPQSRASLAKWRTELR